MNFYKNKSSIEIGDPSMLKLVNYKRKIMYNKKDKNKEHKRVYIMIIMWRMYVVIIMCYVIVWPIVCCYCEAT